MATTQRSSDSGHEHCSPPPAVVDFIQKLRLSNFCSLASALRHDIPCNSGKHIIGGFNVLQELVFEDGVTWLARIPRPDTCWTPEETTRSYAAVLRYLKSKSTVPVPTVFAYAVGSDAENTTGVSYVLMESLLGRPLPTLDPYPDFRDPTADETKNARKIHTQLSEILIELARHTFNSIGTLQENPDGTVVIGEYHDPFFTAYPEERLEAYKKLAANDRGPYTSIVEYYDGITKLNLQQARDFPSSEDVHGGPQALRQYEELGRMSKHFVIEEFNRGPFVIAHNDLTFRNIMVDDDFNITGIIDFPGVTVPLPSLSVFPWMFHENYGGPITKRESFREVFNSLETENQTSALAPLAVRQRLIDSAGGRAKFEQALLGPYTELVLPHLWEDVYGEEYPEDEL